MIFQNLKGFVFLNLKPIFFLRFFCLVLYLETIGAFEKKLFQFLRTYLSYYISQVTVQMCITYLMMVGYPANY